LELKSRIGTLGSHEFQRGIPLKIGGVTLPHARGLGGHSDGDVLLHAITDALLGAIAAPDIGSLFSPFRSEVERSGLGGLSAGSFKARAPGRVRDCQPRLDIIMAEPKIGPHAAAIRARVARC